MFKLRVPNSTKRRDSSAHHAIYDLLGQLLIRDNHDGLRIELLDHTICKFHHVGLSMLASICKTPGRELHTLNASNNQKRGVP